MAKDIADPLSSCLCAYFSKYSVKILSAEFIIFGSAVSLLSIYPERRNHMHRSNITHVDIIVKVM